MYRNKYQKGPFFTVFYSLGSKPLAHWTQQIKNGQCKQVTDADLNSSVLELVGRNVTTCFIYSPIYPFKSMGIRLPCVTFVIKNLQNYFTFEIEIRDNDNQLRRFQASNFLNRPRYSTSITQMPLRLDIGWNKIEIDLVDFTKRAYGTDYVETVGIRVNANVRLRRIFFSDRLYAENEKPEEYRLNGNIVNICNFKDNSGCDHIAGLNA